MFYKNRKKMMYKVAGAVIYCILEQYLCLYDIGLIQERIYNYSKTTKGKIYGNIYGIVIPDILINLVSCHGISTDNQVIKILNYQINMK